ncbi:uncharacterized protein PODANS_1_5540 [Podospora anserina S mat+]|uniref:Alkaline phytoceramidase n=1 Tax=Podospora anserina (strain S / ATCC MYA-4624 / DSM 980 / FGSC 10383) TaxID=515849 RepID=B2AAY0_PODAN|nr:uncharacterized protein PODANS_1_5540 [Podospora anserina S mat+]CAP60242.1 unnamed protein product [Podospora anserina S mat+]CDP22882.1 Putative alkaline phytoceramidase [Podospora anserina S mat+]
MGHHNRHFAGDPHALEGVWSPPTMRISFCEEDYAVSRYFAEFISTLTNLAYVYYALVYMYGPGSKGLFSPRYDFMSISLLVLGIGSFAFHATLRQSMQFADELAMLGLVWSLLQGVLATGTKRDRILNWSMAVGFPLFSAFYISNGKIIYHASAFGLALVLITIRGHYLFLWRNPPFPEAKRVSWKKRGRRTLWLLLIGYALWNIDLEFCTELRSLRVKMGLPWAWVLELHGWWHVLTAVSASWFMDIVREVQEELRDGASLAGKDSESERLKEL